MSFTSQHLFSSPKKEVMILLYTQKRTNSHSFMTCWMPGSGLGAKDSRRKDISPSGTCQQAQKEEHSMGQGLGGCFQIAEVGEGATRTPEAMARSEELWRSTGYPALKGRTGILSQA